MKLIKINKSFKKDGEASDDELDPVYKKLHYRMKQIREDLKKLQNDSAAFVQKAKSLKNEDYESLGNDMIVLIKKSIESL